MKVKAARLESLIEAAGQPEQVTLWAKPKAGSEFIKAAEQNRVATVVQNNTGTKKDFGVIGFETLPNATFLLFPRPLPYAAGTRIVGIKYERIAQPEPKGPLYRPSAKARVSAKPGPSSAKTAAKRPEPASRNSAGEDGSPRRESLARSGAKAGSGQMVHRFAGHSDLPLLARMNQELIADERHRTRLSSEQLAERMSKWLSGDYKAVLFEVDGSVLGYALYRPEPDLIYLRQFFIARGHRRKGLGREAMRLLRERVWPEWRLN